MPVRARMRGDPGGHMPVGEASGANRPEGVQREFLPLPPQWARGRGSPPRQQFCVLGW